MSTKKQRIINKLLTFTPIPDKVYKDKNLRKYLKGLVYKKDDLWWSKEHISVWEKLMKDQVGNYYPWKVWLVLESLGLGNWWEEEHDIKYDVNTGFPLFIDGFKITEEKKNKYEVGIRFGEKDDNWIVPGLTFEEEYFNYKKKKTQYVMFKEEDNLDDYDYESYLPTFFEFSEPFYDSIFYDDFQNDKSEENSINNQVKVSYDYSLLKKDLRGILQQELKRAKAWLSADEKLGMVCLLGPLPMIGHHGWLWKERERNLLLDGGRLSEDGCWKLTFLSKQGFGMTEKLRDRNLANTKNKKHLKIIQNICLNYYKNGEAIPLGVEYTSFGFYTAQIFHNYRADALLVDLDGNLIWLEVMRRELSRLSGNQRRKYELIGHDFLQPLCDYLNLPIRYVMKTPSGINERKFYPFDENFL